MNKINLLFLLIVSTTPFHVNAADDFSDASGSTEISSDSSATDIPMDEDTGVLQSDGSLRPRSLRLPPLEKSAWAFGLQSLQWDEVLKSSAVPTKSTVNFNGIGLVIQKEISYMQWGWNVGGVLGVGRANGGPMTNADQISRQSWSMVGLTPRLFWKVSDRINLGGSALLYHRSISFTSQSGAELSANQNFSATALADMSLEMFESWDFYQALGPIGDGGTLWKIGVNYRF